MSAEGASRARILEAAKAEFGQFAYAAARVARIAQRAGLNKQLLYYYFGSKTGLHEAALSLAASLPAGGSPGPRPGTASDRLRNAVDGLFTELREHPEVVGLLVDRQRSVGAEAGARAFTAARLRGLADVLSEGQGMGYFGDRMDPAEAAGKAFVLCVGYLALEATLPGASRPRATWSAEVSAMLLKAIAW